MVVYYPRTTHLSSAEPYDEVGIEAVLSLPRAVRHHDSPASSLRHLTSLDTLCHRPDLVDLQQQAVTGLLVNTILDTLGVCYQQVITEMLKRGRYILNLEGNKNCAHL